jgi:hypothetical protein
MAFSLQMNFARLKNFKRLGRFYYAAVREKVLGE